MSVHYLETAYVPVVGKAPLRTIHLSPRQEEVLMLLGEGLANKPIGRRLGISACTVKQHVQAILKEFGASNRLQAVIFAYRYGILANELETAAESGGKRDPLPTLVSGV